MRKIVVLVFVVFSSLMFAQQKGEWRLGGGLGVNFGNNGYFAFSVLPNLGYMFTNDFEAGLVTGYQYSKNDISKQNIFRIGPYVNYYPVDFLFARVNYEFLTGSVKSNLIGANNVKSTFDENALWLGAGYRSPGAVQFMAGLMYNVLYDKEKSVYSSAFQPIVGVGVSF